MSDDITFAFDTVAGDDITFEFAQASSGDGSGSGVGALAGAVAAAVTGGVADVKVNVDAGKLSVTVTDEVGLTGVKLPAVPTSSLGQRFTVWFVNVDPSTLTLTANGDAGGVAEYASAPYIEGETDLFALAFEPTTAGGAWLWAPSPVLSYAPGGGATVEDTIADGVTDKAPSQNAVHDALAGKVGTGDSRLSDARTPTGHAASHKAGGSDALWKRATFSNADYTITDTGYESLVVAQTGTLSAARVVTLPAANAIPAGGEVIVQAGAGASSSNTVTIQRAGSDTINGATSIVMSTAYAWRRLISDGTSAWTVDAGLLRFSDVSAFIQTLLDDSDAATARATLGVITAAMWGDGSDGSVTISSNTTLTRNMFYEDLTVNSGVVLETAGFGVWVRGTLTLNGEISNSGSGVTGALPNTLVDRMGVGGGNGGTGSGGGAAAGSGIAGGGTRYGSAGGAGGAGAGGAGGAAGSTTAAADGLLRLGVWAPNTSVMNGGTRIGGGTGGGSGGPASSAAGGNGGGGGGIAVVIARQVTGTGAIRANGGNGANAVNANTGGGGGGGGGAAVLITGSATHSLTVEANGGTAGTGNGTGSNGSAGSNGKAIQIKAVA